MLKDNLKALLSTDFGLLTNPSLVRLKAKDNIEWNSLFGRLYFEELVCLERIAPTILSSIRMSTDEKHATVSTANQVFD